MYQCDIASDTTKSLTDH